jgi:predicted lipase
MSVKAVVLIVLSAILAYVSASSYDFKYGNASLWHAEVTYCDPAHYMSRKYTGYTSSFVPVATIEDSKTSTHGYIGYQSSLNAIFVTFRGSEDIHNWITNLEATTTSYPLCSGCEVHKGFYAAESKVFPSILSTVKSLQAKYPSYVVIATGHSLGAALATLTAFDLVNNGVNNVKLFNYGSPRVGNTKFADWAGSGKIKITRQTHYKVT